MVSGIEAIPLLLTFLHGLAQAEKAWVPTPTKFGLIAKYKTEPTIETADFNITYQSPDPNAVAPGFFFYTLQTFIDGGRAWGPQIFDANGVGLDYRYLAVATD